MKRKNWLLRISLWTLNGLVLLLGVYQWVVIFNRLDDCKVENRQWETVITYCKAHPDRTYMLDVVSMADCYEAEYLPMKSNMLLSGGWISESPLAKERLRSLGGMDMAEVLYYNEDVRLLADVSQDMSWLEKYLIKRFGDCRLVETNRIISGWRAIVEYQVCQSLGCTEGDSVLN